VFPTSHATWQRFYEAPEEKAHVRTDYKWGVRLPNPQNTSPRTRIPAVIHESILCYSHRLSQFAEELGAADRRALGSVVADTQAGAGHAVAEEGDGPVIGPVPGLVRAACALVTFMHLL
jgi:hypothetical protein